MLLMTSLTMTVVRSRGSWNGHPTRTFSKTRCWSTAVFIRTYALICPSIVRYGLTTFPSASRSLLRTSLFQRGGSKMLLQILTPVFSLTPLKISKTQLEWVGQPTHQVLWYAKELGPLLVYIRVLRPWQVHCSWRHNSALIWETGSVQTGNFSPVP